MWVAFIVCYALHLHILGSCYAVHINAFWIWILLDDVYVDFCRGTSASGCPVLLFTYIGETGYGCHTFYITDVFRNIVITADIRLLLCLNIVSCAHINMQFVIFTS